jgi:hypothetical protein
LKATFGKSYKQSREEFFEENKQIKEHLADIGLSSTNAIPNSYLFQSESSSQLWLEKHGKANLIFTKEQQHKMREFFDTLDNHKSGKVKQSDIEETLISFGVCKTFEEVSKITSHLKKDCDGLLSFKEFI